jgi:hypothetical protein
VDTLEYILKEIYTLLKNNVVIKENVHEEDRPAAKSPLLIFYAKVNGSILRICPWQNKRQWSVSDFWPGIVVTHCAMRPLKSIYEVLTSFIG